MRSGHEFRPHRQRVPHRLRVAAHHCRHRPPRPRSRQPPLRRPAHRPDDEILLEAENTVTTGRDATGHAETNLVRLATATYDAGFLRTCSLYTSTEPCAMCSGAIYWGGIGRVVYAPAGTNSWP
ncbi:nucleoside deaminase [Streptomyces celluloflavus]|uniref:nucleoside deaminase n=1 Tax=Streptomyces celluloflavus TaxID=58344 RepID=UPI00364B29AF